MRDRCRSLVGYAPRISGDGRCAEEEAQPRGAALGQGRCRADPPPARLSVWARGREGGHRRRGGEATRACPPALPARRNAGRLLLVEELGQAGRRRHPSAGAPAGGPAAGIALRRVSAAGGRGLAHGSGGDHAGRPLRREARVTAQPSAAAARGRGHRTSPGGNRAPPAAPPAGLRPGWRRRDRQPPAAAAVAEPALREGSRYRPGAAGAARELRWRGRRGGRCPQPGPPAGRARRPHLGAGPTPSLPPAAPAPREGPRSRAARSRPQGARRPEQAVSLRVPAGVHLAVPGARPWDRKGSTVKSERLRRWFTTIKSFPFPQGQGEKVCILF